jgi:Holliday junction resolvase RusA-like endonuclease
VIYKFTIKGRLPDLNDYSKSLKKKLNSPQGKICNEGDLMKQKWQQYIRTFIRRDLKSLKITKPVKIHYFYHEPNDRRDLGNIHSVAQKFIEDALQQCGVLINDNKKCVKGFSVDWDIDRDNPRIEVELEVIE